MEERYWLRHPSLRGTLGPYPLEELRTALIADSFPIDSYVLRDEGQGADQLQASPQWRRLTQVLGLPTPTIPPAPPPLPDAIDLAVKNRGAIRQRSAYGRLRKSVTVGAVIGIALAVGATVKAAIAAVRVGAFGRVGDDLFRGLVWEILVIVVVAGALRALLDIADCALERTPRRQGE